MRRSALILVLVAVLAGCSSGSSTPAAERRSAEPTAPSSPSLVTPASATASPPSAPGTSARAVYYLHDGGAGPRLYREFHPRTTTTAVIRDAVTAMLTVRAFDDDYLSLWPAGTSVRGARVSGTTAYVDLSQEATRSSAGAEAEAASLQQLVYTVTAAAPSVKQVQLLIGGKVVPELWGHVAVDRPIARRMPAEVLGPVWLVVPRTLKRGGRFGGEAGVFEATVSWEFRQGDNVVKRGFTNASTGAPGRGPWSDVADVPAGEYELRAFESSAKDGMPTFIDDKPVTITG